MSKKIQPKGQYNMEENTVEYGDAFWCDILDFRFKVEVVKNSRVNEKGTLRIFDGDDNKLIYSKGVNLKYNPFSSTSEILNEWRKQVENYIDNVFLKKCRK